MRCALDGNGGAVLSYATRVPLRGEIDDPAADIWATIGGLLRNAFIESLRRGLEGSIDIARLAADDEPQAD